MADLKIAPGLKLDADYIGGGTLALLAKKGAGKSYTARVMAEEFWKAKVPFVLIDPMGTQWGLRASADGEGEGIPVAIFGGEHGDAPLERSSGAMIADLVVDEGLSMILDLSALGSRSAERQFARDFFDRLYRRNRDLVHLLVDEADLFAPQKPQAGDRELLGITENIVRRGRNRGIGITLITQRPAVLNKDVLTQIDALVAMRVVGLTDRNAIDDWVAGHGHDAEKAATIKGTLASLKNGESWWWVPELGILERVQVRRSETFDSSPTKKRGQRRREPKTFADVDMGAIEQRMAATIERAKHDDPKELRKQVADLRRQLAAAEKRPAAEPKVEYVDVPVLEDVHAEALGDLVEQLGEHAGKIIAAANDIAGGLRKVTGQQRRVEPPARAPVPAPRAPAARRQSLPPRDAPRQSPPAGDVDLTGPQRRILDALAWLGAVGFPQPTKIQIGFIAGYRVGKKVGGTFGNVLGELRAKGLIDYPRSGHAALTDDGRAHATIPDIEPTTEGLQQAVFARLDNPERRVLEVIVAEYPDALTKQEAGERAGYTVGDRVGGTYGNILGRLRSLGLIDYPQQGYVAAEPVLFLDAAAA